MPRDGQSPEYDATLAAGGFDSAHLFRITLHGGATVYVSDVAVTVAGQSYGPEVRELPEVIFSDDEQGDGARFPMTLQNADGLFGATDENGVSPLDGASVLYSRAVSGPGGGAWHTDEIGYFVVRHLTVNEGEARFTLIADHADPSKVMSGESVFLEELAPVAAEVSGAVVVPGGGVVGGDTGGGQRDLESFGGYRGGGFFRPSDDTLDHRPLLY
ncbi:MAG TPA: hypothetical protein VK421_06005 [Pyrinomonadaceae bacterium]|nr:hypothetical protein [Pyrinomonadaceae bacterium]